ncbi:MAG: hypothetical protein IKO27_03670 [Ruminococcus sp.]|nr:hypothetical protein [Ruminococcus sp.]
MCCYLYDSEQKQIDSYAVTTGNTETVKSTNYGLKKGTYYIRVKKYDYYTGVGYRERYISG